MAKMRLSDMKKIIAEMEAQAASVGNDDPSVEFCVADLDFNLVLMPLVNSTVRDYMVKFEGTCADRGDFCLMLTDADL